MKRLLTIVVILIGITAYSQEFGASALKVAGQFDKYGRPVYKVWQKQPEKNDVIMKFEKTPKGVDEALKMVKQLLLANQLDFLNPDIYKSSQSPDLSKTSPIALYNALQNPDTKIVLAWFAPDSSTLFLVLNKGSYEINVLRAYKTE
jgi:hypothetical protein